LENRKAESLLKTAKFYERQKHYESAAIYYREVIDKYPRSPSADKASAKLIKAEKIVRKKKEREIEYAEKTKDRKPKKWIFF